MVDHVTTLMPPEKPRDRIWAYERNDMQLWKDEECVFGIPYVRASKADEDKSQRDWLLAALKDCVDGIVEVADGMDMLQRKVNMLVEKHGGRKAYVSTQDIRERMKQYKTLIAACEDTSNA